MRYSVRTYLLTLGAAALLTTGCFRGLPSDEPPVHVNPNMDTQEKYKPYRSSEFFADGSAMREPVAGTIPQGGLMHDSVYFFGKDSRGQLVERMPIEVTMETLKRGQQRFNIFCRPCHGAAGDGRGTVVLANKGLLPPPSFHDQRLVDTADGHFFDVMTNGVRNMPSYSHQIPVEDRWAIVSYVRALQRSQRARLEDIPEEKRGDVR